ncbi:BGTF surface domain-containing protein [Halomicroarcula sp. GCM10025817]|uniref:BGTF surface domain-containing protein n=1 Tax=Haloarcula TaxID=2237 RepID=UPI0023E7AB09|nr:BGTF surface domain-containing protein [Halomicroarcula sp. SYNS111]
MNSHRVAVVAGLGLVALVLAGAAVGVPLVTGDEVHSGQPAPAAAPNETAIQPGAESLVLRATANETVRGTTGVAAGTDLTVRLKSTDSASPFLYTESATVRENGTFAASFDLRGVEENATATVVVRNDTGALANRTARIDASVSAESTPEPTPAPGTHIVHEGDRLTVDAAADQTIRGTTDVGAGSELTVRVRSTDSANPFLRQEPAVVQDDGSFSVTMDFASVEENATFQVSVRHNGTALTEVPGEVA